MPTKTKIADPMTNVTVAIPVSDALYLARAGVAAVSKDDITPIITGVLISAKSGVVTVLSTDRYRVHRATATVEDVPPLPPFLVPAKALKWLIANASFFGRGMLPPIVTIDFAPTEETKPNANRTGTPTPRGMVTITIREHDGDDSAYIQHKARLIAGNFPSSIEKLLDEALTAEPSSDDRGTIDLDLLAGCRALATYRGERPKVRLIASDNPNKSGKVLVSYGSGVALIQKGGQPMTITDTSAVSLALFGPEWAGMTPATDFTGADALETKVRSRDPESSWRAARISTPEQLVVKDFILLILARRGPLTDDQIFDAYQASGGKRLPQRVRTARSELRYPKRGPALVELADELGVSRAGTEGTQRWQIAAVQS